MRWTRFYTQADRDFLAETRFRSVTGENQQTYIIPQHWSDAAADLLLESVFYPHTLPAALQQVEEAGVPAWLWRSAADTTAEWRSGYEKDIRAVLHRMAGALAWQGWKDRLFDTEEDARVFYDEFRYILLHQIAAPELLQWQRLGLSWAYGLTDAPPYTPQARAATFTQDTDNVLRRLRLLGEARALENTPGKLNVILPIENAESLGFINWKKSADVRLAAEALGQRVMESAARRVMDACDRDEPGGFDPAQNETLATAIDDARRAGLPEAGIRMTISYAEQGFEDISFPLPAADDRMIEDVVETTVSIPDGFIEAALTDHAYKQRPAQKLWDALTEAVWASGEPAISFRDSAGDMAENAAPAATLNLLAFAATKEIVDTAALRHVTRLMTVALDILPTAAPQLRPVSLGVTNIAALLMSKGLAYDSDAGRATAALVTGLVTGAAHHASAEMAARLAPFPAWEENAKTYLQNVKNMMALLSGTAFLPKGAMRRPVQLRLALCPDVFLAEAAKDVWEDAYRIGKETGFRHAHLTGIGNDRFWQPLLGAQTQGVMPVTEHLHGKNLNPLIPAALKSLGYDSKTCDDIHFHAAGHGTLLDAPHINHAVLRAKGFPQAALDAIESALTTALHIRYVFNRWTLGEDLCLHILGLDAEDLYDDAFDMLPALGFSEEQIQAANAYCCGTMSLSGAPQLKPAHAAVFNSAVTPGAQTKMQAAVEPFLSGSLPHTIRLTSDATVDDVRTLILSSWETGLKSLRLYRDNGTLLHAVAPAFAQISEDKNSEEIQDSGVFSHKISA